FKKNKKILLILIFALLISFWCASCERNAYFEPEWERKDISALLEKEKLNEKDYALLRTQTGLSKSGIDSLIKSGRKEEIYDFQEQYFAPCEYEREFLFVPIVAYEHKTGEGVKTVPLEKGDVLVSLTTHSLGFRHGHAGLVLDEETGKTLEHMVIGELSGYSNAKTWDIYPTFAVLRHKDNAVAEKAAEYAKEHLVGVAYNPLAGIIKKDKSVEEEISSSHCSHLVWQAYFAVGEDIDGNGGRVVLPKDFLECEDFEIAQIYGIEP
ncbi:MAG: hypothetical protein IKC07_02830, partial [Clostridia bacterium]|nr:hypothetical protein [Clostridia bacterium]